MGKLKGHDTGNSQGVSNVTRHSLILPPQKKGFDKFLFGY